MITSCTARGKEKIGGTIRAMNWIYLSPHLDDAVYSCGGLIWEQTQAENAVEIWTLCAGDPPPGPLSPFAQALHTRWGTGTDVGPVRRAEDEQAAARVGAAIRHLALPDCIYRRAPSGEGFYTSEKAIFGEIHPAEQLVVNWFSHLLASHIPAGTLVVCPLTLGGHVDHQLVRTAAERAGRVSRYYADFPYVMRADVHLEKYVPAGWKPEVFPISHAGMQAWEEAAALYVSQFSTFWRGRAALQAELHAYCQQFGGIQLWSCD